MKSKHLNSENQFLRQKAKQFLKIKPLKPLLPASKSESLKLIQELEIYQVELKLQNEELLQAKNDIQLLAEKYTELYDFAPIGYFTLTKDTEILNLNHAGAQLLGNVHSNLINCQFIQFVTKDTIPILNHFISKVFSSKFKQYCEIYLQTRLDKSICVHLDGIIDANGDKCLITAVDISNLKLLEGELRESEMFLKKTQQIARLGTFTLDFYLQTWESSEVLDSIFGIDITYDKSLYAWKSIIHPDYQDLIMNYLLNQVVNAKVEFDMEFKIIRQNDKAERWVHAINDLEVYEDVKHNTHYRLIGTLRDITERKQAEKERSYLVAAVENVVDRVVVKDLDLKIVSANKAWLKARGRSSIQEVIGLTDVDVFGLPMNEEPVRTWMEDERSVKQLAEGEFIIKEQPIQLATGENTIALVRRFPIYDNAGVLFCLGTIATDITERKKMEVELKESELFLSQTQVIANLGSYIANIHDGTWKCSEILNGIFGIKNEYIKTHETWVSIIHPDWRDIMIDYYANHVLKNRNNFDLEYKIIRQNDNVERWVHGFGQVQYNEKQEPITMIGTIQDITSRKEVEAQVLRNFKFTEALIKSIPIPVFFKDLNERYLGCNDAFTNHLGFSEEFVKGKTIMDLFPGEQSALYHQKDLETLAGEKYLIYEAKVLDKENRSRDAIFFKNVFYDENGKVAGIVGAYIDITDRKKIEEERRYLIAAVQNTDNVLTVKDLNLRVIAGNQAFVNAIGHSTIDTAIGKTDAELFNIDQDTEPIHTYMEDEKNAQKLNPGEYILREEPLIMANGQVKTMLTKKYPVFDDNGNLICTSNVSIDITERKLEEEKMRKSEEKYRTVANYTNDWEFWIDENENFIYCSPSCETITGYNYNEFIQNPMLQYAIVFPEDFIFFKNHRRKEDLNEEGHKEIQYRIVRADGEIRWIGHVSRPVYNEFQQFAGIRGSNRDITVKKELEQQLIRSEQKYKLISKNISDGVFICKNGIIEFVNESMNKIFGYDDDELLNRQLIDLVDANFQTDLVDFLDLKKSMNKLFNMDVKCEKKDKSTIYVDLLINYIETEKIFYGVAHDVTEKKQIQRKNILQAIIQTEEKEKSYFSKEIHDGLGPLLSTIKLYLQLSARQKNAETRYEIIQKAEKILEEALIAVTEISNKLSPHLLQDYGLTSAIQSFVNKLITTSVVKVYFVSNVERRLDVEIEVALYRAVIECVNNTIKHAMAKNIQIKINDIGHQIVLKYIDDGIGYDFDKVISEQKGLGLFNLTNRIQTIGGKLKLYSKPGHGVDYQIIIDVKD